MILIIGKGRAPVGTAREIFFGMGIICESCEPCEVKSRLSDRHSAVLSVGRNLGMEAGELVAGIREINRELPVIALREDFCSREAAEFDAVYPNSLYCTLAVKKMRELAEERGLRAVGDYSLHGLSVRAGEATLLSGERVPLTKAESAVLRTVIAVYPEKITAQVIAELAFRAGREPSASGVRTHISAINKKLSALQSEHIIAATGEGYTVGQRTPAAI